MDRSVARIEDDAEGESRSVRQRGRSPEESDDPHQPRREPTVDDRLCLVLGPLIEPRHRLHELLDRGHPAGVEPEPQQGRGQQDEGEEGQECGECQRGGVRRNIVVERFATERPYQGNGPAVVWSSRVRRSERSHPLRRFSRARFIGGGNRRSGGIRSSKRRHSTAPVLLAVLRVQSVQTAGARRHPRPLRGADRR